MSVLFHDRFADTTLHVLHIRGRTAFLALEIGAAAGHSDGGQGFVDLLTREWAASFDEDEDVAQLVGAELDALKREVPLPPTTTTVIVLFSTGVDRALLRSHARNARALLGFIHGRILSRVISLAGGRDDDSSGGAPAEAPPPSGLPKRAAVLVRTPAIRDANGAALADGDTVTVIKDLKIRGTSQVVKVGTKVKNIRLVGGDHDIDCKIEGFGAMKLKSEFVKKS